MEDGSDNNSIENFEFSFFLKHGYMPSDAQKKAHQKNTECSKTKKIETYFETSTEDNYAEFEAALGIKKTKIIENNADNNQNSSHNENYSEASCEDNYREFQAALGLNANKSDTPQKVNNKTSSKNYTSDTLPSIQHENIENNAALYSQFVNSIERESISVENASKIDSARKSKNYYATKKPNKNQIHPQDKIDLHGDTQSIAKSRLINFIHRSKAKGYTQILVIHGKGLHNENKIAVLKDMVECYVQTEGSHLIKNMIEAPPNLGGSGAKVMWI